MKALQAYVDQVNKWNAVFKGEQIDLTTTRGRKQVACMLDGALSPENLSCDGERSRAEVARRFQELTQAVQELIQLDPAVKMYEFYSGD